MLALLRVEFPEDTDRSITAFPVPITPSRLAEDVLPLITVTPVAYCHQFDVSSDHPWLFGSLIVNLIVVLSVVIDDGYDTVTEPAVALPLGELPALWDTLMVIIVEPHENVMEPLLDEPELDAKVAVTEPLPVPLELLRVIQFPDFDNVHPALEPSMIVNTCDPPLAEIVDRVEGDIEPVAEPLPD